MKKLKHTFYILFAMMFFSASSAYAFNIIAFGDSITQGFQPNRCEAPNTKSYTTSCGYINELTSLLRNNGTPSRVYNWGWAREMVTRNNVSHIHRHYSYSSGVDRFMKMIDDTLSANIDYVLIHEGTNDLGFFSSASIANGLESMVSYSLSKGVTPILATVTPRIDGRTNRSRHLDLNRRIIDIANRYDIVYADQFSALGGFNGFGGYHTGDGLHINDRGYGRMASTWLNAIREDERRAAERAAIEAALEAERQATWNAIMFMLLSD